jgi:hypothetical protein
MIDAGAPSTGRLLAYVACCARPTGGGHGLTTDDPAQRFEGAELRAALQEAPCRARPRAL